MGCKSIMGTSLNGFVERFNRNIMGCKCLQDELV